MFRCILLPFTSMFLLSCTGTGGNIGVMICKSQCTVAYGVGVDGCMELSEGIVRNICLAEAESALDLCPVLCEQIKTEEDRASLVICQQALARYDRDRDYQLRELEVDACDASWDLLTRYEQALFQNWKYRQD